MPGVTSAPGRYPSRDRGVAWRVRPGVTRARPRCVVAWRREDRLHRRRPGRAVPRHPGQARRARARGRRLRAQPPGRHVRVRRRVLRRDARATSPPPIPRRHAQITAGSRAGTTSRSTSAARCCARPATASAASSARRCSRSCRRAPRSSASGVEFEHEVRSLAERRQRRRDRRVRRRRELGARRARRASCSPTVDVRPNKFVWLGCTVPYRAFTFLFKETPHGLFRVHAYRYHERRLDVHRRVPRRRPGAPPGSTTPTRTRTVAILERDVRRRARRPPADQEPLDLAQLPDRALRQVAHRQRRAGRRRRAHRALLDRLGHQARDGGRDRAARRAARARATSPRALAAYEARRRPEVEALQAAAQASLEWFEGTERYAAMAPVQFTYSLMTRSLRVSHASVAQARSAPRARRRAAARRVASAIAERSAARRRPRCRSRSAIARARIADRGRAATARRRSPRDDDQLVALGGAAAAGAGLVVTPAAIAARRPRSPTDDARRRVAARSSTTSTARAR